MATVTGLTAARMLAIEDASVVNGEVDGTGHLILTTHGGSEIDAGYVWGTVVDASETQKGIVELATAAETATGTDGTRAVTPLGLAGVVVQTTSAASFTEASLPSAYPVGMSRMLISDTQATASWPSIAGKLGMLETFKYSGNDILQIWRRIHSSSTTIAEMWIRTGNNGSGWGVFQKVALSSPSAQSNFDVAPRTVTSTTFVAASTEVVTNFIGPPSGEVEILWRAFMANTTASSDNSTSFEVRAGTTVGSGSVIAAATGLNALRIVGGSSVLQNSCQFDRVSGLTPGSSYHARMMHASSGGTINLNNRLLRVRPVI